MEILTNDWVHLKNLFTHEVLLVVAEYIVIYIEISWTIYIILTMTHYPWSSYYNYILLQFVWIRNFSRWEVSIACWSAIHTYLLISSVKEKLIDTEHERSQRCSWSSNWVFSAIKILNAYLWNNCNCYHNTVLISFINFKM